LLFLFLLAAPLEVLQPGTQFRFIPASFRFPQLLP
jgi:hypothetical protein